MKLRHLVIAMLLCPMLIQGLCNKEDVQQVACTEMVTWTGSGIDSFYKSTEHDSHFRELYFAAMNAPEDICTDVELTSSFKITSMNGEKIPNVILIEGKIVWGNQEKSVMLPYSDIDHAYIGSIGDIDLKPYFDEHPTPDGSGSIEAHFIWHNLSVGAEATDLQYVIDKVAAMDVQVEYIRK
jgi:hypothetical protein